MKNVVIKTANLCKSYANGKNVQHVLKNINLEIYEEDFTVIMGSSGSGKSTLLYSISSMDQPTSGKVKLLGKEFSDLTETEASRLRSKDIAFVFQSMNLLPDLTAYENIAYPAYLVCSKQEANKEAEQLLEQFDLVEVKDKYPSEMSGGQQQRIGIARAVAKHPKILFGDEPTGALNSAAGTQVLDLLTKLNQEGQTIVMVTHDIKACARGNRLLFLSDGRIEGDLNLGHYNPVEQAEREETIFKFLKQHNW
ncbi:MAG: ABC transporter ATP-binding protein [Clostridiales bacterium]|nr:ABC transporter ATP-binding protein [Clostridiales bacterium]